MGQLLQCLGFTPPQQAAALNKVVKTHPLPLRTASHTPSSLWGQTLNNTDSWDHSPRPEDVEGRSGGREAGRKREEKKNDGEAGGDSREPQLLLALSGLVRE